jgi:hypothetical protein
MMGDVIAWQLEKSGIFSERSAYKLAFNELPEQCSFGTSINQPAGDDPCWSRIRQADAPPKVKTFAWKASLNALATKVNKLKRNMRVTRFCNICGIEKEDGAHGLYHCPHAFSL